jgi:3-deoxy-D-manno-octulosonate 8-phosphate phosphatase (KDO 8-P phosphatase)
MLDTSKSVAGRCSRIELLVLDVDGVLSDGAIIYADTGMELKHFHVRDGSGLKIWHASGKRTAIITGRNSRVVEMRAAELGIETVIQGAADKLQAYRQTLRQTRLAPERVCCVGDDLPDLPLLRHCGFAVAVADACAETKADAHYVTHAAGGRGAVREVIELILGCQDLWRPAVERLRTQSLE